MGSSSVSLNGLFKQVYGDKLKEMFTEEVWIKDTKIARKMNKNNILEEKEGWFMLKRGSTVRLNPLLDRIKK